MFKASLTDFLISPISSSHACSAGDDRKACASHTHAHAKKRQNTREEEFCTEPASRSPQAFGFIIVTSYDKVLSTRAKRFNPSLASHRQLEHIH